MSFVAKWPAHSSQYMLVNKKWHKKGGVWKDKERRRKESRADSHCLQSHLTLKVACLYMLHIACTSSWGRLWELQDLQTSACLLHRAGSNTSETLNQHLQDNWEQGHIQVFTCPKALKSSFKCCKIFIGCMKPCGRIVVQISSNYFLCARRVTWKAYFCKWICIVPLLSTLWPPTHPVSRNHLIVFLRVDMLLLGWSGKTGKWPRQRL